MDDYLEAGKVINTHGLNGYIKIECWCDSTSVMKNLKRIFLFQSSAYVQYDILKSFIKDDFIYLLLGSIDSIDEAIKLKNSVIYANRNDFSLPENTFFVNDLIGLHFIDENNGSDYGTVTDLIKEKNQEWFEVLFNGKKYMVPNVKDFIKKIDINDNIYVSLIPGLIDDI